MKIKTKNLFSTSSILTLGALFVLPVVGNAATLVNYPFTTATGDPLTWNSTVTPVEGTSVTRALPGVHSSTAAVPGVGKGGASNIYYQMDVLNDEQGVIDKNYYLEFTITPDAGLAVSYDSFSLTYGATSIAIGGIDYTWNANYFVRTSLDGYSTNVATFTYNVPATGGTVDQDYSLDLSLLNDFQMVDEALTFRIYAYSSDFAGGPHTFNTGARPRVTDIKVEGTVAVIPESSTAVFVALAALGLGVVVHHRRRAWVGRQDA